MPLPVPLEYCLAAYHSDYDAEKTPLSRFQTMLSGVKCGKSMSYLGPTPFNVAHRLRAFGRLLIMGFGIWIWVLGWLTPYLI